MSYRGGFTLVETLVVMAVTTVLFVAIASTLGARQGRVQFSQGMREIEAELRDIFNDLADGFYPTTPGLICTASGTSQPRLDFNSADPQDTTGAKDQCVFAGKVVQFGASSDAEADRMITYIMAGRRVVDSSAPDPEPITNFANFKPIVISSLNTNNLVGGNPSISEIDLGTSDKSLPNGIHYVNFNKQAAGRAIGVIYNNFRGSSPGGGQTSGTTGIGIARVYSNASLSQMTPQNVIEAADSLEAADFITGNQTVTLCFESGTTDQTATITIGQGIQGGVTVDFDVDLTTVNCV